MIIRLLPFFPFSAPFYNYLARRSIFNVYMELEDNRSYLPVRKVLRMRILHEPECHRDHLAVQKQSYDVKTSRCPDDKLA